MQQFVNNATTTLAVAIDTDDTSVTVATGDGALFPSLSGDDYFVATLEEGATREIVLVTARSGDVLTVTRAQEGTAAASFTTAATVEARLTAGAFDQMARLDAKNVFAAPVVMRGDLAFTPSASSSGYLYIYSDGFLDFGNGAGTLDAWFYRSAAATLEIGPNLTVGGVAAVVTTDARLSDARTPTAHTHTAAEISNSTATGRSKCPSRKVK